MFDGKRLKQVRLIYGMTRKKLADKIQVEEKDVVEFERYSQKPERSTMLRICQLFGVKESYFHQEYGNNFDMSSASFRQWY